MRLVLASLYLLSYLTGIAGLGMMFFIKNSSRQREQYWYRLFLAVFLLYIMHKNSGFICSSFLGMPGYFNIPWYFAADMIVSALMTASYSLFCTSLTDKKQPRTWRAAGLALSLVPLILLAVGLLLPAGSSAALRVLFMKANVLVFAAVVIASILFFIKNRHRAVTPVASEMMRYTITGNSLFVLFFTAQIFYNFDEGHPLIPLSVENLYFAVINMANILVIARSELLVPDRPDDSMPDLTIREREILERLVRGLGNKQIAGELAISELTVRNYLNRLYKKAGVKNRIEMTGLLKRTGRF
jgi:DNA-binding CsgD family transcriptional regulator